jgi:NADP-reducing hydrogenase subunit HndB
MAMTLEELRALRASKQQELSQRETADASAQIIIGMGTCGIAAGAKRTFSAMLDEIAAQGVKDVVVKQTGCIGQCSFEPTVEVRKNGMPDIVYGKVDEAVGRQIVQSHIMKGELVGEHIYDKPAADLMAKAGA